MKRIVALTSLTLLTPGLALAGGFDTPMLYSARHMGMGGTAVSYVHDASAMFHNPAGIGHTLSGSALVNFSPLFGGIKGSPSPVARSIDSETTFSPAFLVGGTYRILDFLTAGFAVYPVAAAGGAYLYDRPQGAGTARVTDELQLTFIEASPALALNFDDTPIGAIRVGVGYRITSVSLSRLQSTEGSELPFIDFSMSGLNFTGFRAGLQYQPIEEIQLGLTYRSKTVTQIEDPEGTVLFMTARDLNTEFTLPSRLTAGLRGDYLGFALSYDLEVGFNSQNTSAPIAGVDEAGNVVSVDNVFNWSNALTHRFGLEYSGLTLGDAGRLAFRAGFIRDNTTTNPTYVSAFGTPPAPTHAFTLGAGFNGGPWEVNVAFARRSGALNGLEVPPQTAAECPFCGYSGDYKIQLTGVYVDFSWNFGTPDADSSSAVAAL